MSFFKHLNPSSSRNKFPTRSLIYSENPQMFPSLETHCLKPPSLSLSLTSVSKSFIIENSSLTYRSSSDNWIDSHPIKARPLRICNSYSESGSISPQAPDNIPLSLELEPITSESQFYRIVAESQGCQESFLVLWMAKWCRKCIYLKPKLEKLAADYSPRLRFYSVDVNNVPHKLVVSAGVTKMPTVQLWRNGRKQVEVIGGHKAYLVVNEVREIIENEDSLS